LTEKDELAREIELQAERAERDGDTGVDIKSVAVGLWANFNEFSLEEIESALREALRIHGFSFNDHAGG